MESNAESKKASESGLDNNGMDNDDVEVKEENKKQESVSDPKRCSQGQGSQDSDQVKGSAESDSIRQRRSEESIPDGFGGRVKSVSKVHKLLSARYAALGPLSFKEQQVQLLCNV